MIKIDTPLSVDQIDFRVQSINKGGYATILAYKDARVDMNRLDEVYGVDGWQKEYRELKGRLYCRVGIYSDKVGAWVWKEDVGTESNTEAVKGEASDAFKRACFNFGVGRELYAYPRINVKLKPEEFTVDGNRAKQTFKLMLKDWNWKVYFDGKRVGYMCARDQLGHMRFEHYTLEGLEDTIRVMKEGIDGKNYGIAYEAWDECTQGQKAALWVAETKGGPFNAKQRKVIQSEEFRLGGADVIPDE